MNHRWMMTILYNHPYQQRHIMWHNPKARRGVADTKSWISFHHPPDPHQNQKSQNDHRPIRIGSMQRTVPTGNILRLSILRLSGDANTCNIPSTQSASLGSRWNTVVLMTSPKVATRLKVANMEGIADQLYRYPSAELLLLIDERTLSGRTTAAVLLCDAS